MNRTKIDWRNPAEGWKLDYTWNPVVGCKRNCYYCYARKMNNRFKWIPDWNELKFYDERLYEPYAIKNQPSTIFVGSMTDIAYWKKEWMNDIISVCAACDRHTFMFLTKDGYCYNRYVFPQNCILGATIVGGFPETAYRLEWLRETVNKNRKFVSIEPLLGSFDNQDLSFADLVIVGAMTGPGAVVPRKEWIDSIKHPNIHYKANIRKYMNTQEINNA